MTATDPALPGAPSAGTTITIPSYPCDRGNPTGQRSWHHFQVGPYGACCIYCGQRPQGAAPGEPRPVLPVPASGPYIVTCAVQPTAQ